MNEHYYTEHPTVAHKRQEIAFTHGSVQLALTTDSGVFSRDAVDPGTKLLITSVQPPRTGLILDVGCGYGPIGLYFAAVCPDCTVHMTDVNERAAALTIENAARNKLQNVQVHVGEGFTAVPENKFDLILTNPPIRAGKQVLLALFAGAYTHLRPGGRFAFVARTQQGAKTLARELERIFGNVTDLARGGGYRVYKATRV